MSVLEIFWEILGYYAVRKEHVILFRLFITLGLILTPSYTTVYLIHFYSSPVTFDGVFTKLLIMAGLSITNRLVLSYFSIQVYRNFNKVLRPKLFLLPTFGFLGSLFLKKVIRRSNTKGQTTPRVEIRDDNEDSENSSQKEEEIEREGSQYPRETSQYPPSLSYASSLGPPGLPSANNITTASFMADIVIHGSHQRQEIIRNNNRNEISKDLIQPGTVLSDTVVVIPQDVNIQLDTHVNGRKDETLDSSGSGLPKSPTGPVITPGSSNLAPIQL